MLIWLARRHPTPERYRFVFRTMPRAIKLLESMALITMSVLTVFAYFALLKIPGTAWLIPGWLEGSVSSIGLPFCVATAGVSFGLFGILQWLERLRADAAEKTARMSSELETSSGLSPQNNLVRDLVDVVCRDFKDWKETERKAAGQVLRHYAKIASGILDGRLVDGALDVMLRANVREDARHLRDLVYEQVLPPSNAPLPRYRPSLAARARLLPRSGFEDLDILLSLWGARPTVDDAVPTSLSRIEVLAAPAPLPEALATRPQAVPLEVRETPLRDMETPESQRAQTVSR